MRQFLGTWKYGILRNAASVSIPACGNCQGMWVNMQRNVIVARCCCQCQILTCLLSASLGIPQEFLPSNRGTLNSCNTSWKLILKWNHQSQQHKHARDCMHKQVLPDKSPPKATWRSSCQGLLAAWSLPVPAAWTTFQRWGKTRSESPPPESDQNLETCSHSEHLIPLFPPCCLVCKQLLLHKEGQINTIKSMNVHLNWFSATVKKKLTCQSWVPSCGRCGCKCLEGTGWGHSWLTPLSCFPFGEKLSQNICVLTVKDILLPSLSTTE